MQSFIELNDGRIIVPRGLGSQRKRSFAGYDPRTYTLPVHSVYVYQRPANCNEGQYTHAYRQDFTSRKRARARLCRHRIFCYRIRWPEAPPRAWAPRRARRSLGIDSEALGAGFVPIRARSCAVPAGLLLGVVSIQRC